mmetsp:Transcript_26758/g.39582  ORF Transcript_26758/g.39582 Transcript_26758/m.39582 type:complete len:388 (+) Transcript_26758:43-1206(+)
MNNLGKLLAFIILSPLLVPLIILAYLVHVIVALLIPVKFTKWFIFNVPGASWQQGDLASDMIQPVHRSAPEISKLPASGELIELDFRRDDSNDNPQNGRPIRALSYNIFLAQNLEGIIEELASVKPPPDVIFLQEDNIYKLCDVEDGKSSTYHHAGAAIARSLNMSCIFVNAHYRPNGCYGMSILSRFKLRNTVALKCPMQPWIVDQMATWLKGERHFPYAEIGEGNNVVGLVSVHLPSVGKFKEKVDMLDCLFEQLKAKTVDDRKHAIVPKIVGGDMNTAPLFYRWILPFGSNDLYWSCVSETHLFRRFILRSEYTDPFSDDDGTFQFPGGVEGKLDWMLFQNDYFEVQSFEVQLRAITSVTASDHRWISATFTKQSALSSKPTQD